MELDPDYEKDITPEIIATQIKFIAICNVQQQYTILLVN
jgi:hypothetical protein